MAKSGTNIAQAIDLLQNGQLVAIPTETVYGLAGNALDTAAVARIFEAKGRPHFDPLIVHLYHKKQVEDYCRDIPEVFNKLYEAFSPGPITYILKKKTIIPDLVTSGNDTVGIRFPNHPLTRELLLESNLPLAAPSANPFGYVSPTTATHVENQLGDKIPYILDGGPCDVGIESTIIDLSRQKPRVLRLGGLALEDLKKITPDIEINTHSSSNPKAPGMLSSHYSPGKKLIIGNVQELLKKHSGPHTATITLSQIFDTIPNDNQKVLSPTGNLNEAATKLFKSLRELDREDVKIILAELMPERGLGPAINDRLNRAAR